MSEPGLTRRVLLARLTGVAALPFATVSCGRDPAGGTVPQAARPLHYASLADVAKLVAAGKLLSTDLTQQLLDRIAAVDGRLQSYVTVMAAWRSRALSARTPRFAPAGTAGLSMACPSQ